MKRFCVAVLCGLFSCAALAQAGGEPLQFRITEGRVENAFYQDGPVAAHLLLSSGVQPRVLVAFPAGNSGVGVWFDDMAQPVRWTLGSVHGTQADDAQGRPLHGIVVEASVAAAQPLVVKDAVLGSVRVLRDYQLAQPYPPETAAVARATEHGVAWSRARLDGAPGYEIRLELQNGRVAGGHGAPLSLVPARSGEPLRLRITALSGEKPLTPFAPEALFNGRAGSDERSRNALCFLSYQEKFLAGSWRFDTYFGRDTLMSLRLLMPALRPEAIEDGLVAVLERMNADGEVAHEEDIGEFAVLRHRKEGAAAATAADSPIYDYKMIDDDRMLAPVAAAYLLDTAEGRSRAAAFLARKTAAGETVGAALMRNFAFVVRSGQPFVREPTAAHLIALKPGQKVGQWRDSEDGLAGGRYPYDVNAVFMPAALRGIARLQRAGLLAPYPDAARQPGFADVEAAAAAWERHAPPLFDVSLDAATARANVARYARAQGIDPAAALASLPRAALRFHALSLDAQGRPIRVLHSDDGFALLFGHPPAAELDATVEAMLRPFPAGLLTDVGLLVANPAYADAAVAQRFGRNAYHGAVVWSWQQALLAAGLERQLQRDDLPATVLARLREAQRRLWNAIEATRTLRTSELWSWSYADGHYRMQPFGQGSGDADESNAAQLWSTVYLAVHATGNADGAIALPGFSVPFSAYASPEALQRFQGVLAEGKASPGLAGGIEAARAFYDRINRDRVERMRKMFPVALSTDSIAGVGVDIVEPAGGIAPRNRGRVLINLHGGAFLWGARSGALVEAIPVAAKGGIRVVGVDYRQGPEHVFPAATDDVVAVYKALLRQYPAANIGIYGCSAGGFLTGEVVARLIGDGIALPGAIGTFCGSIAPVAGDSAYVGPVLSGDPVGSGPVSMVERLPYFKGASADDPLVVPGNDPGMLAKFPPTLLISGTRDFAMSSVLQSQRLLTNAGVEAELHVWDGMWHSFFSDPELPESQEAYAAMAAFFDRRLGR